MNRKRIRNMLHAYVELDPVPRYNGTSVLKNVWRVTGYDSVSGQERMVLDHISGGFRCPLFSDRVRRYDAADLGYRGFRQGRLVLTVQIDFSDGMPMRETVMR